MTRVTCLALVTTIAFYLAGGNQAHAQKAEPLPEGSQKKTVTIYCDGIKMQGDLYLPPDHKKEDKRPAVIFCNGTGGTKSGTATKLAPHFLKAGYVFLA